MYVTVYVPDYVTGIYVLGFGTNEGSSPRSGRGNPLSLVPTVSSYLVHNIRLEIVHVSRILRRFQNIMIPKNWKNWNGKG